MASGSVASWDGFAQSVQWVQWGAGWAWGFTGRHPDAQSKPKMTDDRECCAAHGIKPMEVDAAYVGNYGKAEAGPARPVS